MSKKVFRCQNTFAKLGDSFFTKQKAKAFVEPELIHFNEKLAAEFGVKKENLTDQEWARLLCGKDEIEGSDPLAMVYAGHQFGGYSGQLGDGRGLLLTEILDNKDQAWDLHLKGAGSTPYSRMGDGRAVLRSSVREYLGSEALHGLGMKTTRALSLVGSSEQVQREEVEYATMLTRVARTHIRFGHFEFFYYTKQLDELKSLFEHTIKNHFPEIAGKKDEARLFLRAVVKYTAEMIAEWQAFGFTHGVMNSDNMNVLGEAFDFGPFAFMERYDPNFTPNHSDHQGRYAFKEQSSIGMWNLNCLANTMIPFVERDHLRAELSEYKGIFVKHYLKLMREKMGLQTLLDEEDFIFTTIQLIQKKKIDYTRFFRSLCEEHFHIALFVMEEDEECREWQLAYQHLCAQVKGGLDLDRMKRKNPAYIPRTHLLQKAIEKAEEGDFSEIDRQLKLYQSPYDEVEGEEDYLFEPEDGTPRVCLSCSS